MLVACWRALACAALLVLSADALAWGRNGHQIIAAAALKQLSPAAKAEIERLLALEPGATLESISTWADEVRAPSTASWRFVNFRQGQPCEYQSNLGPDDKCVVAAIERQAAVLASTVSDEQRLKALKYVVHFVADVHQPLHAGYLEDRGGNSYQVQAFGKGSNLHALWDVGLIEHWPGGIEVLASDVAGAARPDGEVDQSGPSQWAEASCRIVSTQGFYPEGHQVDGQYARQWRQTLRDQLTRAADRLAKVLEASLGRQGR